VLLFEQEQVPLVHQRRHLSSRFKFFLSSANNEGAPRGHKRRKREKRKRLRSQTRALCCVRVWKARISLSRNGFLLGEEKRLENSEGNIPLNSLLQQGKIFHCVVVHKRKRQKMRLLPKPIWNLTLTIEQQQTRKHELVSVEKDANARLWLLHVF
jgi:hypothetical protein